MVDVIGTFRTPATGAYDRTTIFTMPACLPARRQHEFPSGPELGAETAAEWHPLLLVEDGNLQMVGAVRAHPAAGTGSRLVRLANPAGPAVPEGAEE